MKYNDLVSIIVPFYNSQDSIYRCIKSLLSQSYKNIEIILIDDGSTDESASICDNLLQDNASVIQYFYQTNSGVAIARNSGLEKANGDFIMYCDSDDYYDENMVEKLINNQKEFDSDIAMCGLKLIKNATLVMKKLNFENSFYVDSFRIMEMYLKEDMILSSPCNKLFKKEILKGIVFPCGEIFEDRTASLEYFSKCKKVSFINECLYNCILKDNSITRSGFNVKYLVFNQIACRDIAYFKQHYPQLLPDCYELALRNTFDLILKPILINSYASYKNEYSETVAFVKKYLLKNIKLTSIKTFIEVILLIYFVSLARIWYYFKFSRNQKHEA